MGRIVGRKRSTLKGKQSKSQDGTTPDPTCQSAPETVHRRNVHLFAQPVIIVFNVVRFVAFQLWLLLSLVYRVGSNVAGARSQTDQTAAGQVDTATVTTASVRRRKNVCFIKCQSPSLRHKQIYKDKRAIFCFFVCLSAVFVRGVHPKGGRGAMLNRNLRGLQILDQPIDTRTLVR